MTNYQTFKQKKYLPNLTHINSLLSPKNKQPLQQLLSPESYTLLTNLITKLKTTIETQPKKYKHFHSSIFLTNNYAKTQLNLSYHKLQNALDFLQQFNLITISYYYPISNHKTRTISLQLPNFQDFNILLNKYKKVTSNSNYNFTHFFKPLKKYLNSTYTFDYDEVLL